MSKVVKDMIHDEIKGQLGEVQDLLLLDLSKLDGNSSNRLRIGLEKQNIYALTVKNTLARKVLHERGVDQVDSLFEGPTTLVWGGEDVVQLSRAITAWAKDLEELAIKGASVEGKPLDEAGVVSLSKSPGRQELLSEVVMLMLSPARQIAGALLGPARTIAGQVTAIAEKEE